MIDQFGRSIDYLRISITDRCNLRCRYCMPQGAEPLGHGDILRFEEILRVCRAAAALGVTRFKITGGEPLVRRGCAELVAGIKAIPGAEQVTLTTNGLLLDAQLDALLEAGLDAVNVSLDSRPAAPPPIPRSCSPCCAAAAGAACARRSTPCCCRKTGTTGCRWRRSPESCRSTCASSS